MIERLLRSKFFPAAIQWPLLVGAAIAVGLSLWSPRHSEINLGAALTWQLWWALLPFALYLTARAWCAVCPFTLLGDTVQRLRAAPLPVPGPALRELLQWLGVAGLGLLGLLFLLLSLETNGPLTAVLLLVFAVGAALGGATWRGRVWCRYLCPVGLLAGLYSRFALLGLDARGGAREAALAASDCPLFTTPVSKRASHDCVLCGTCLKAESGGAVSVRIGRARQGESLLVGPEAVAAALLLGLLIGDATRMTPLFTRFMAWAMPQFRRGYEETMAAGVVVLVLAVLVGLVALARLSSGRGSFWREFGRLALAVVPVVFAAQITLSAQHLLAAPEVLRNLASELRLVEPGHMPPTDAYAVVWPLRVLQWTALATAGLVSLRVARSSPGPILRSGGVAAATLLLLVIFGQPMSVAC